MSWQYSPKTTELFMDAVHGKPGTHLGEIENPDGIGEHGSIACGDALRFTFRVDRHPSDPLQDKIVETRYLTFGCTSAIASSEALCRLIEEGHYTPVGALRIRNADIVHYLDGLPEQKLHCSVMGAEALEAAVFNWAQRRGVDLAKLGIDLQTGEENEGRLVCKCFNLTEPYLRRKIAELNLRTIADITNATKAGGACMNCHYTPGGLQDLLDEIWGRQPTIVKHEAASPAVAAATPPEGGEMEPLPYKIIKKIEQTIEDYIRPQIAGDGGNIEIVDIKGTLIYCRLGGSCRGCMHADQTMKLMVERTLKEMVDERLRIISV